MGIQPPVENPPGVHDPLSGPGIKLEYRNIAKADVTVYPVDLMQLYLTRRNLNGIAGIDLAGITPLVEKTVSLGDGSDYDDRSRMIDLPLAKEGAYLVMIRGENLYASGIVLVSPLELEALEEPASGRVRITVRDARTKELAAEGSSQGDRQQQSGILLWHHRFAGVFVAEGIQGQVTAIGRKESTEYAFYRGTSYVGQPPVPQPSANMSPQGQAPATTGPASQWSHDEPGTRCQPEDAEHEQ